MINHFDPQKIIDFATACGALKQSIVGDWAVISKTGSGTIYSKRLLQPHYTIAMTTAKTSATGEWYDVLNIGSIDSPALLLYPERIKEKYPLS